MNRIRLLISSGLGIALLGGILAYYMYNKPHRNIAKEKVSYTLTADELFNVFEQDETAAMKKYVDEVIIVSGTVSEILKGEKTQFILSAENAMLGGINAQIDPKYLNELNSVSENSLVSLKCRCVGLNIDVVLDNCSPVKSES